MDDLTKLAQALQDISGGRPVRFEYRSSVWSVGVSGDGVVVGATAIEGVKTLLRAYADGSAKAIAELQERLQELQAEVKKRQDAAAVAVAAVAEVAPEVTP